MMDTVGSHAEVHAGGESMMRASVDVDVLHARPKQSVLVIRLRGKQGVVPFVILQLIGLAVVLFWPQLVIWLPAVAYG